MKLDQFDYHLPNERIAQQLSEPRDACRLLVLNRGSGETTHKQFNELTELLGAGDVLVLNETKVIPARLLGHKPTGGKVEVLLVHVDNGHWQAIAKPGLKPGMEIVFGELKMTVLEALDDGILSVKFNLEGEPFWAALDSVGHTPLPPYIDSKDSEAKLRTEYQTIYAKQLGSVAAPTAGFHFTQELLGDLIDRGVEIHRVTLHVSLGTFRPVKAENIEEHLMHPEWFSLSRETAMALNKAKGKGKRIISVGTTTTRVLETCAEEDGLLTPKEGETSIFIYPPYKFKFVDALITNFHLPKSTLLMLVSAFVCQPNTTHRFLNFGSSVVGRAYYEAIKMDYRFYSFGDAMLIW